MRRLAAALLAAALCLSLSACGLKGAVQEKTREILGGGTAESAENGESGGAADDGTRAPTGSGLTPSGSPRPIATVPPGASYEEMLENEWINAPEEGYVWTITINDVDVLDVMGLCTATYNVKLSASHIGPDLFGTYFGDFGFDYSADMEGLETLLTMQGGSVEYDTDGWFENDEFYFKLFPYNPEDDAMMEEVAAILSGEDELTPEERAIANAYLGMFFDLDNEKDFEKNGTPEAMWWSFDIPMTDGDMSGYFQMNGILGGIVEGRSEVDEQGKNVAADVRVAFGLYAIGSLIWKFDERYTETETFENPLPYTIKVYGDNNVVMTFFSANGGPVTTKLYGTIDKIPVGETTAIRP
ncbi:MAG: hypothetical protein LBT12_00205 [Oscillospiraceae bacterium]|jgi:hypothetical protein|nr:hypothetical protein [Oscillospiraceae bacterium]